MKIYNKILMAGAMLMALAGFSACDKADPEFEHDNVLLSDVRIKTNTGAEGIAGTITEYNAAGEVVPTADVTLKSVEGGYGKVEFILAPSYKGVYNPERCYLGASLTFDQIVTPGLSGIKNITNRNAEGVAEGIWVTVTSGVGTTRRYNIIGYFEGEYTVTE